MKPMKKLSAFLITLAFAGLSGCGSPTEGGSFGSITQGLTINQSPYYGAQNGTYYEPVNSSQVYPVIRIEGWHDSDLIYGFKLKTSNNHTRMYGPVSPHGTKLTFNVPNGKLVNRIDVNVDGSNVLRGVHIYTNDGGAPGETWGLMGMSPQTVFSPEGAACPGLTWTDMAGYEDHLTYRTFVSASFYHTCN